MAYSKVIIGGKAIFVVWQFEVLMMEGDTLLDLAIIEQIDCHPVRTQRHTYFILHSLCETQKSLVKLDCFVIGSFLLVDHTQIESKMGLFLDIFSAHAGLCSHKEFSQCAFFTGQEWYRWCIAWSRTDSWCDGAIGHIWRLYPDLLLIKVALSIRLHVPRRSILKQVYALIVMFSHFCLRNFFDFLFIWWCPWALLKLQQFLIILTNLFSVHDLLTFRFLLDLWKNLLPRVKENLFEILHIAFLSA